METLLYIFGISTIVLLLREITDTKCGLLSKHLFQRTQQHGGLTKPLVNYNQRLYNNMCLKNNAFQLSRVIKSIDRNKLYQWYKHLERLSCSCYFQRFVRRFFSDRVTKFIVHILHQSILWSVQAFFKFPEKKRPNGSWLWEENLVFHMQIFSVMCLSVNLFSKVAV